MWLQVEWLDLTRIFFNCECCLQLRINCRYDQLQILGFFFTLLTYPWPTYLPRTCTMKSLHRRLNLGPTMVNQYLGAIQDAI